MIVGWYVTLLYSNCNEDELDAAILSYLNLHHERGQRMIMGHLLSSTYSSFKCCFLKKLQTAYFSFTWLILKSQKMFALFSES